MAWTVTLVEANNNEDIGNDISPLTIKRSATPKTLPPGFECNDFVTDATLNDFNPLRILFPSATDDNLQPNYTAFGDVIGKPEYEIDDIKSTIKLTGVPDKNEMVFEAADWNNPNTSPLQSMAIPESLASSGSPFGLFLGNACCSFDMLKALEIYQYLKTGGSGPSNLEDISLVTSEYPEGNGYNVSSGTNFKCNKTIDKDTKLYNVDWPLGFMAIECSGGESLRFNLGSGSAKLTCKIQGYETEFYNYHTFDDCYSQGEGGIPFPLFNSTLSIVYTGGVYNLIVNVQLMDTSLAGSFTATRTLKVGISEDNEPVATLPQYFSGNMRFGSALNVANDLDPMLHYRQVNITIS